MAEVTTANEQQALEGVLIHGKEYWLGLTDVEEQGDDNLMSQDSRQVTCQEHGSGLRVGRRQSTSTGPRRSPTTTGTRTMC